MSRANQRSPREIDLTTNCNKAHRNESILLVIFLFDGFTDILQLVVVDFGLEEVVLLRVGSRKNCEECEKIYALQRSCSLVTLR